MIYSPKNLGRYGEQLARQYLESRGYQHLISNYCIRGGELDLVVFDDHSVVVCEVKTRLIHQDQQIEQPISIKQRSRILRAAWALAEREEKLQTRSWQFLAVSIKLSLSPNIKHQINVTPLFWD